jgi:hypothetical protein
MTTIKLKVTQILHIINFITIPVFFHNEIEWPTCFFFRGCETWSLVLREKRRSRVFENSVLRRIFETKMWWDAGENCIIQSFRICTLKKY